MILMLQLNKVNFRILEKFTQTAQTQIHLVLFLSFWHLEKVQCQG